jgi:hypothetical protein
MTAAVAKSVLKKATRGMINPFFPGVNHGGLILWVRDHFKKRIESAVSWLDRCPGFKIKIGIHRSSIP